MAEISGDERLKARIGSTSDAIYSKDDQGLITSWNPGAERLYGYTQAEALGAPISILIPADRKGEEIQILEHVLAGDRIEHHETQRITKDAKIIDVSISVSPVYDSDGRVREASVIARDITERKRIQEILAAAHEAQAAKRAIEEFVAMAAHDLRTPLSVVMGMAALLKQRRKDEADEQELEALDHLERNTQYMSRLVADLLLISRAEADALYPEPDVVDVSELLNDWASRLSIDIDMGSIPEGTAVYVDPDHFGRIVTNYLVNAQRYGAPPFTVSATADGETVDLRVADSGPGVPDDLAAEVFDKFVRGPGSNPVDSTGLGLAIARSLAHANGGEVWHEPNKPSGSVFCLRLPEAPRELVK